MLKHLNDEIRNAVSFAVVSPQTREELITATIGYRTDKPENLSATIQVAQKLAADPTFTAIETAADKSGEAFEGFVLYHDQLRRAGTLPDDIHKMAGQLLQIWETMDQGRDKYISKICTENKLSENDALIVRSALNMTSPQTIEHEKARIQQDNESMAPIPPGRGR